MYLSKVYNLMFFMYVQSVAQPSLQLILEFFHQLKNTY